MNTKDEEAEDEYSTDEFEESMDGDVDTKAAAQDYESDEFEVCFEKNRSPDTTFDKNIRNENLQNRRAMKK